MNTPSARPLPANLSTHVPVDLLVLAGGRGTRLGGADKAALDVGGRPLLSRLLDGVGAGGRNPLGGRVVVVGQTPVPAGVLQTVEDPPGGGPVAGVAAGLELLGRSSSHEWVAVVAVDQPGAAGVLTVLKDQLPVVPDIVDAICPSAPGSRRQWMLALYRVSRLRAAVAALPQTQDASMRDLVRDIRWLVVATGEDLPLGDVDTWDDVRDWEGRLGT